MPLNRVIVESLMDKPVFVKSKDNITTVIETLLQSRKGCVLINNAQNETVGIISDRDILRSILENKTLLSQGLKAKDIMVSLVIMITNTQSLKSAEDIMRKNKINRLPVVENPKSKKVIGIVNYDTVHKNLLTSFATKWINRQR
ncbi:MAG: CBS domain-containing protein [Asgard group archaeon]|nr:CBS domain-containing protein [Asgard group archaeon]